MGWVISARGWVVVLWGRRRGWAGGQRTTGRAARRARVENGFVGGFRPRAEPPWLAWVASRAWAAVIASRYPGRVGNASWLGWRAVGHVLRGLPGACGERFCGWGF